MNFLFEQEIIDYDFFNNNKQDTIIFLHGWGGNKNSFISTINLLKYNYNVLSITLPTIIETASSFDMFDYLLIVRRLIKLHNISSLIIVCHSFGFRVCLLLSKYIKIKKIIVTGGAGYTKQNCIKKIENQNNKILLKQNRFKYLYITTASKDYINLSFTNKTTFKNIVNLNLDFIKNLNCPMLLFWGNKDTETKLWIAKKINKNNNSRLVTVNSDHFAYIHKNAKFNNEVLKFLHDN